MKRILFLSVLTLLLGVSGYAQMSNCTQVLRLAQSTYEQGRLHELPSLMDDCLKKPEVEGGFTKQQKVDAYRYLTLAYIYLEEPEKADEAMLNLLNTDHYFEVNPAVDPAEFVALYNTFRHTPLFGIGVKFGVNATFPMVSKNYYVGNDAQGHGTYGTTVAFQAGIVLERNLFDSWRNKTLKRITFSPELFYTLRSLSYTNNSVFAADDDNTISEAKQTAAIKQTWFDINPIFQYKLHVKDGGLNPYIGFGPGASLLINASNQYTLTRNGGVGTVSGASIDVTKTYRPFIPSLIAVAGVKYKFGAIKLNAEVRVQYGLTNVLNPAKRTNSESVFDNLYQGNDWKQVNAMVNFGFVYPYFNPIKKTHKRKKK